MSKFWNFIKDGFLLKSTWKALIVHPILFLIASFFFVIWFFSFSLPSTTHFGLTSTVPDIQGESLESAITILEKNKLGYKVIDSTFSANYNPSSVISYVPKAGEMVKENRTIYLTIRSKNAPKAKVPSQLSEDWSVKQVIFLLESAGFQIGKLIPIPVNSGSEGIALKVLNNGVELNGNEMIPLDSKIDIEFGARDSTPVQVPLLLGKKLLDAKKNIYEIPLRYVAIYDSESEEEPGTIFKQSPKPDSEVTKGTEIELWISGENEVKSE